MTTKMENYLRAIGLVTDKDTVRHEHLALALHALKSQNLNNKSRNRFTGHTDTLASVMAEAIGRDKNYVTKEMAVWLDRFRAAYDPTKPEFTNVCEPKIVKILTPWQLLYLISLDFYQKHKA